VILSGTEALRQQILIERQERQIDDLRDAVRKLAIVAQGYLDSLNKLTSTSKSEMSAEGAEIERIAGVAERGASDYDTLSGLVKAALTRGARSTPSSRSSTAWNKLQIKSVLTIMQNIVSPVSFASVTTQSSIV